MTHGLDPDNTDLSNAIVGMCNTNPISKGAKNDLQDCARYRNTKHQKGHRITSPR